MKRGGEIAQRVIVGFLVAQQMPLQLQVGVGAPEHADEPIEQPADAETRRRSASRARRARSSPLVWPSSSSSVSAPSPFGARSFIIVSSRQRLR